MTGGNFNMKISDKTYIVVLFIVIISLCLLNYWRFKDFNQSLSKINLPNIEIPETNLDDYLIPEKEGFLEWSSPDELFGFRYSANWTEIHDFLSMAPEETKIDLSNSEILFLAQRLDVKGQSLAFLTVKDFGTQKTLEEIITEIEQDSVDQNETVKIEILETNNDFAFLGIISESSGQPNFYSKAKIIFLENKTYIIIFTAPQADWEIFKNEAEEIFNSITFNEH